MEQIIKDIAALIEAGAVPDKRGLAALMRRHNEGRDPSEHFAKKRLLPYYQAVKRNDPDRWASWGISEETEEKLLRVIQMKPRRSASGVATISVLTKPHTCTSSCLYCPNDVRMPKSYLHDEPACQRAERAYFDPYLQVSSRMRALREMGHNTAKVELIVLGGTWSDYPKRYRCWFVRELFRALNEEGTDNAETEIADRRARYREMGIENDPDALAARCSHLQQQVIEGRVSFNEAIEELYGRDPSWTAARAWQIADEESVSEQQQLNETSAHRVVGLVFETRPDTVNVETLLHMRSLGATKLQMGLQSLDDSILEANGRFAQRSSIETAFRLLRLFGFKIHVHLMLNLLNSNPEIDLQQFRTLLEDPSLRPDEVKLYPCVLVDGARLQKNWKDGSWLPYDDRTLVDVLARQVALSPCYLRISRMIRDISAPDIIAGSNRTNLRQMVGEKLRTDETPVHEIRFREIATDEIDEETLRMECFAYETTVSEERFYQWLANDDRIVGFLRLSLPKTEAVEELAAECIPSNQAMIREVHVYGRSEQLHAKGRSQHLGLGKQLVSRACDDARAAGYDRIAVISAIGTREYYRNLGFSDNGLYQAKQL